MGAFEITTGILQIVGTTVTVPGVRMVDRGAQVRFELPISVRRQPHRHGSTAVVRISQCNDVLIAGVLSRRQDRDLVGFAARVRKVSLIQPGRHFLSQLLRELADGRVQVDGCRVLQPANLRKRRQKQPQRRRRKQTYNPR